MLSLFALHESNRFVQVSEVERGLACDCLCAVCCEPVIARQGELREHHFAHSSNAEPCASSYESDLHRFAKRVIIEARGLVVPVTPAASQALGFGGRLDPSVLLACTDIEGEVAVGELRSDLLAATAAGVTVAIEVADSFFCSAEKCHAYEQLKLPSLEIDLRTFTPSAFDVAKVKHVIMEDVAGIAWLWPKNIEAEQPVDASAENAPRPHFVPEEIVTIHGRWISVKELLSGDIAIKAVGYDTDVVSVVRTVARAHFGRYRESYHNWVIPRFRAQAARLQLRSIASADLC